MREFFKNKFNLTLFILQCVAVLFFCLINVWSICFVFAIFCEGAFFIVLGIAILNKNKQISKKESLLHNLPMQKNDIEDMEKRNKQKIKLNKFQAVLYIIMGILLIFLCVF